MFNPNTKVKFLVDGTNIDETKLDFRNAKQLETMSEISISSSGNEDFSGVFVVVVSFHDHEMVSRDAGSW